MQHQRGERDGRRAEKEGGRERERVRGKSGRESGAVGRGKAARENEQRRTVELWRKEGEREREREIERDSAARQRVGLESERGVRRKSALVARLTVQEVAPI